MMITFEIDKSAMECFAPYAKPQQVEGYLREIADIATGLASEHDAYSLDSGDVYFGVQDDAAMEWSDGLSWAGKTAVLSSLGADSVNRIFKDCVKSYGAESFDNSEDLTANLIRHLSTRCIKPVW